LFLCIQVEKVQYMNFIKEIPTPEGRNAAMAVFCGQMQDAESILLQSGLVYRAIQMYLDLYNWDRLVEMIAMFVCFSQSFFSCSVYGFYGSYNLFF